MTPVRVALATVYLIAAVVLYADLIVFRPF